MNKNSKIIIISLVIFAAVILVENFLFRIYEERDAKQINVSLIMRDGIKSWDDIKAGASQAAGNDADISIITLPEDCSTQDQYNAIISEFNNDADYVLTTAIDSYSLPDLMGNGLSDKVYFIENGVENDAFTTIEPDHYQMGISIANLILKEESADTSVAIIEGNRNTRLFNERLKGTVTILEEAGIKYDSWDCNYSSDANTAMLLKIMNGSPDVIVVLDEVSLATAVEAVAMAESNASIYAIANSDEAVYYLDNRQVKYLIYPDEFGMGYAAVKNILDSSAYINSDFKRLITFKTVNREDMYTGAYEKVLFPFVK